MSLKRTKRSRRSNASKLSRKQLYGLAIITIIAVSSLAVYAFFTQANGSQLKAAIVDQLSSRDEFKNATFVKTANATLTAAGYTVTYYKGSDVTVDFYRYLPLQGYKIIILRVHSALFNGNSTPLDLFTSEPFDPKAYISDRVLGYLDIAMYQQGGAQFFGIKPSFVGNAMQGSFGNTLLIMMGCNGVDKWGRAQTMLASLTGKGAKVIIGWSDAVSMDHTDSATTRLLHHLLIESQTIKNAVDATTTEVGRDPVYNSTLTYYRNPYQNPSIDSYTVPHQPIISTNETGTFFILGTVTSLTLPMPPFTEKSLASTKT